ncbi:hypothetical protein ACTZWW_05035 [Salinarimonas sp. NSM]|uniref:hypothetical protein n=1 Tax=Salinarimonas sp. NSM TaxID=3458003 RepID=UPI004035FE75
MVVSIDTSRAPSRKAPAPSARSTPASVPPPTNPLQLPFALPEEVTPDEFVAIIAALEEEGGTRTLGDLALAIPASARPISAILALADAGVVVFDAAAPFDAMIQVTRI